MFNENIIRDPEVLLNTFEDLHPSDIANSLKKIENDSKEDFFRVLKSLPEDILGEVLLELPDNLRENAYEELSSKKLSGALDELESDDQTDIIQELEEINQIKFASGAYYAN